MSGIAKDAAGKVEGYEVFLKYLPESAKPEELKAYFASAGEIVGEPRLMIHSQTGKCKGVGWLTFATREGLAEAVRGNGCNFGGRSLAIQLRKSPCDITNRTVRLTADRRTHRCSLRVLSSLFR